MSMEVFCPHCDKTLRLRDRSFIGKRVRCPACETPFTIEDPGLDDEFDEPPDDFDAAFGRRPSRSRSRAGIDDYEDDYGDYGEPQRPERRRRRKAAPPPQRGSTWVKPVLITGVVVLGLLVLGSLIWYAVGSKLGDPQHISACVPTDYQCVIAMQPDKLLDSPLGDLFRADLSGPQQKEFLKAVGMSSFSDFESALVCSPNFDSVLKLSQMNASAEGIVIYRAKKDLAHRKAKRGNKRRTHAGEAYHVDRMNFAFYFPDRRTIIVGSEASVKKAIDQVKKGPRSDLKSVDLDQTMAFVFTEKNGSALPPGSANDADASMKPLLQGLASQARTVAIGVTFPASGATLKFQCSCRDAAGAEKVSKSLKDAVDGFRKNAGLAFLMNPRIGPAMKQLTESLKVQQTGGNVTATLSATQASLNAIKSSFGGMGAGNQNPGGFNPGGFPR